MAGGQPVATTPAGGIGRPALHRHSVNLRTTGRIDVHCHLLPDVDDGCESYAQSIDCARQFVAAGYSHVFCTPHIWHTLPNNRMENIRSWTQKLQDELNHQAIPLTVLPGGEINLRPETAHLLEADLVTFADARKHVLFDLWADRLPAHFEPAVRRFQALGVTPILAHPERMRAVQDDPGLADYFEEIGVLLQGNLYCLIESDLAPRSATRTAEQFLTEGRYFLLGSDCHKPDTLPVRFAGLRRAVELAGPAAVERLTVLNPQSLLPRPVPAVQ